MFFETVYTPGLAHMSYVIGDAGKAAVIDPRRDSEVYIRIAGEHQARITHVFETHRHEDFVIGSIDLARRTGARICHSRALDFDYGEGTSEGESFEFGSIGLSVLATPGHTDESISLVMTDAVSGAGPVAVFTGDALFVGGVGRTDFYPDRAEQAASALYDSIFEKLLPLGDGVLLHPAHGAGSVCGISMWSRRFSTLGYERRHSFALQKSRSEFIRHKLNEHHYKPPYFACMHRWNKEGAVPLAMPVPEALQPGEFSTAVRAGMVVVDVREPEAFIGAAVPGSLSLPLDMLASFAGWLLSYDDEIGLVADGYAQVEDAVLGLVRMGYERVSAFLAGGMPAWQSSGREYQSIPAVNAQRLLERIESGEKFLLLDVRSQGEYDRDHIPDSLHIYVGELAARLKEVPEQRPVTCFCSTGRWATTAASILCRGGIEMVEDCLGSMEAVTAVEARRAAGIGR
ncbi:MAG TPA: MBL fold metallo-hydrolase [Planctomycetota bacterium]|nr:MBL fold metallo-hydrolase [Planctomycetota bacterium]